MDQDDQDVIETTNNHLRMRLDSEALRPADAWSHGNELICHYAGGTSCYTLFQVGI